MAKTATHTQAHIKTQTQAKTKIKSQRDCLQVWLGDAPVGDLFHQRGVYSFAYHPAWLRSPQRFWLDPELQLFTGEQYPASEGNFGVFLDSAPDRWGRLLMERREQLDAQAESRPVRMLREWDFLSGVQDITRMGALRFCLPQTAAGVPASADFLDNQLRAAPPITSLAELHAISHAVESDDWQSASALNAADPTRADQRQWLAQLVAPGSSLGGARPKANFTHTDGSLWIAKFPSREDRRNVAAWEMLLHTLAQQSGITVPPAQLLHLNSANDAHSYPSFAVQRFDRYFDHNFESASPSGNGSPTQQRLLFVSAMTLLQAKDGERQHSYCDLAHFIAQHGAAGCVEMDLEQLFRRVVFNILTSNRDDHLRNHGFIRQPSGWRLSPAFDLNPNPEKYDHALAIAPQGAAPTVATAIATAQHYRLSGEDVWASFP
jgi:serine/threonine-protein kinase HipA